jgi:DNA-binding beta-propeller fold protein YncE
MTRRLQLRRGLLCAGLAALAAALVSVPSANAFPVVGGPGEGAGQISKPRGVAVDIESGRLYVADAGNIRVDVFNANTGAFEMAFGWGVKDGSAELQRCGPAATPPSATCRKGLTGSGDGEFGEPVSIAVDNEGASASHHDVYVADSHGESSRVEKFSPGGGFLLDFGESGKGECQFAPESVESHPLAIGPGGTVYVADTVFLGATESDGFRDRVEKFEPDSPNACIETLQVAEVLKGESPSGHPSVTGLAVDSSGDFYASFPTFPSGPTSRGPQVHKFDPSGNLLDNVGASTFGGALAVDAADNLFVSNGSSIEEFDSSGAELRVFGYGVFASDPTGLAAFHTASGDLYASERPTGQSSARVLYVPFSAPGPIILPEAGLTEASPVGNTKATLDAQVNPEGKATKFHTEYITEADFQKNLGEGHEGFAGAIRAPASATEDPTVGPDFEVDEARATVGCPNPTQQLIAEGKCLSPETEYRFRAFAENADGEGNSPVEGEPFTTKAPMELGSIWSSQVGSESAVLSAEINPLGIAASGHFQYIADGPDFQANGFEHAVDTASLDFGSAEEQTVQSVPIGTLDPHTTYHYRIVASDLFVPEEIGPTQTVRTFSGAAAAALPDGRTYELVSPAIKNSGEVGVPTSSGGSAEKSVQPQQASPTGQRLAYTSFTAFGQSPGSAPAASQYLSTLAPGAWSTLNINPRFEEGYTRDPFVGFSSDLSHAAAIVIEPPLTADATEGFPNLYVRNNETGSLTTITTRSHEPKVAPNVKYCLSYGGASADFGRVIFSATGALNQGDKVKEGFNLYEWSEAEGIQLVSRLPGSNAAAEPKFRTGFGPISNLTERFCEPKTKLLRHAISADGSRIFWTLEGTAEGAKEPLFARIDGKETLRLDKPNVGVVPTTGGEGQYWDASADGGKVFFTDAQKLTTDATPAGRPDLYLYDFAAQERRRLTDLSVDPGEAANVQGVVGASDDGLYVYFVARGVLAANHNSQDAAASPEANNLYAWHGGETRFIATLGSDASDWGANPSTQSARVSPDGRHLAFISTAPITGYDNLRAKSSDESGCQLSKLGLDDLVGSSKCAEVFIYDFEGGELSCASCDPSNARPLGPSRVPTWSTPYQQPRFLSDDGSRLFFDTLDSLDPRDTNGKRDVYEFERAGAGSCSADSSTFVAASGGCLFLISSGESNDDSYFLDASANGEGSFFGTRQRLLFSDEDERFDIYDARVGGVLPPTPKPPCEGQSCPNGGSAAAPIPLPGTSAGGPGNPPPSRQCPKGTRKVRRHGKERCVKSAKHQKRKQHRADGNRGGAR